MFILVSWRLRNDRERIVAGASVQTQQSSCTSYRVGICAKNMSSWSLPLCVCYHSLSEELDIVVQHCCLALERLNFAKQCDISNKVGTMEATFSKRKAERTVSRMKLLHPNPDLYPKLLHFRLLWCFCDECARSSWASGQSRYVLTNKQWHVK